MIHEQRHARCTADVILSCDYRISFINYGAIETSWREIIAFYISRKIRSEENHSIIYQVPLRLENYTSMEHYSEQTLERKSEIHKNQFQRNENKVRRSVALSLFLSMFVCVQSSSRICNNPIDKHWCKKQSVYETRMHAKNSLAQTERVSISI